jgi:uncharacterized protein YdbL (DUF1318 family)
MIGFTDANRLGSRVATATLALVALVLTLPIAQAQSRDPAYAAARASGQVGEQGDGYLGVVGGGTPALHHMVEDINIRRKSVYSERAQAQHATVEEYAFTTGCLLIAQTQQGEKYQAPGGNWQTRTAGPPMRDSRCPG